MTNTRPHPKQLAITIGAIVALAAAGGGFAAGRATAPDESQAAKNACTSTLADFHAAMKASEEANANGTTTPGQEQALIATNIVLQNPTCFSAKDRASVQTWKEQGQSADLRDAICDASDESWWSC